MKTGADSYNRFLKSNGYTTPYGQLMVSTLAINMLSLALPIMTLQVYDRILPNPGSGTLPVIITGVCLAIFLEAILRLARSYLLSWSGAIYEHKLSCKAMEHMLNADLSMIGAKGIGENLNRMSSIARIKDFNNGHSFVTIFELAFVPVFLGVALYIAGPLAVVPVIVLMFFTLVSLALGQNLCQKLGEREATDDDRHNFLISSLENIHTVKSMALENILARKYEALEEPSTRANFNVTEATSKSFNTGMVFSHIMVASVVTVGAILVLKGMITTGALIATILLSGRMMQPVQKAIILWTRYQDYKIADERMRNIFSNPLHMPVSFEEKPPSEGRLEIKNLSFKFGGRDEWFLENIDLNVNPGDVILLSGAHGEGKTTLLKLIAGIYPPGDGEVVIDDHNILSYSTEDHAKHVGFVRTSGVIFSGTIRDNMTCFSLTEESKARDVARLLNVDRDVARLPSGFDTILSGSGTDSIPPGLKQRISIVRSLAHKPRLILFDNADAGLDREGYNAVYSLLAQLKGKATLILVSDDYNICDLATRFFTLKDGRLTETNSFVSSGYTQPHRELKS